MFKPWWELAMLAAESQQVIVLRCMRLAAGGSQAPVEARRMVSEKFVTAAQAMTGVMLGESPARTVKRYRRKVGANRRRLMK